MLKAVATQAEKSPQATARGENFNSLKLPSVTIRATPMAASTMHRHSTGEMRRPLVSASQTAASRGVKVRKIAAVPALE